MITNDTNRGAISERAFSDEIIASGGPRIFACYQCLKCTNGCPVAFSMDFKPHQLIRMIQLGMRNQLLNSKAIWVCSSCKICSTRCPNNLDIAGLMDSLRRLAIFYGNLPNLEKAATFHRIFLNNIRTFGRIFELGMIGEFKFRSQKIFSDFNLGAKMLMKNRFRFLPRRIKGMPQIKDIFSKTINGR